MGVTHAVCNILHVGRYSFRTQERKTTRDGLTYCALRIETLAIAFLTLHLTGSGAALGVATAARLLPFLVLAPWAA